MADKPSRGLVLYGDGLVRYLKPSHTHLNSLASRGSCGFLSLPHSPPSESEDERIVREFAQLLDACEAYTTGEGTAKLECQKKSLTPTVSERFMGIKAAIITNNSTLQSFSGKLGLTVLQFHELAKNDDPLAEPPLDIATSVLLKLLGFQEGKTLESSQFDLVFVHIGATEKSKMPKGRTVANDIEYANGLIGKILQISLPGSEIGSRLHLSVVMSYGNVLENDDSSLSVMTTKGKNNSDLSLLFPRQSYTMKGGSQRENVRHYCPLLTAQWQDAVTRKDMAETFSFKDLKEVDPKDPIYFQERGKTSKDQARSKRNEERKKEEQNNHKRAFGLHPDDRDWIPMIEISPVASSSSGRKRLHLDDCDWISIIMI